MKSIYNHRGTHNRTDFTGVTFNIMSKNVHDLEASVDGDCRTAVSAGTLCPALSGRVPGRTPSHEVLLPNSFNAQAQDTAVSLPGMLTAPCDRKDSATENSKKVKK